MNTRYLLAIDVGTSVSKVIAYDETFRKITDARDEITTYHPQPHFFEQDPNQWWLNVRREIDEVVTKINPKEIIGIGVCAQMHAPILVTKEGGPLYSCLNWPDLRTVEITKEMNRTLAVKQSFYTSMAPKLLWIKRNHPKLLEKTYKILLPKDFIRMKLSNTFCTDWNDAKSTGMFDVKKGTWIEEIVNYLEIDTKKFPVPQKSEEVVGSIPRDIAEKTGLIEGTPVITGAPDNLGRTLDRTAAHAKDLLVYLGTGAMVEYISESGAKPQGTFRSILGVAGTVPQWFKNNFCKEDMLNAQKRGVDTYMFLDSKAQTLEPGAGGLVFLPHIMGERAFEGKTRNEPGNFNPYARGVLFGLCLGHSREHIFRAIREGSVYQLYLSWERIQSLNPGITANRIVVSGGGAQSRFQRQIIADVFGLPVWVPKETETGSLAVSCLIAVSAGLQQDFTDAIQQIDNPLSKLVEPIESNRGKYHKTYALYKRVEEDLKDLLLVPKP
ncbi:MAG: xylulokinase [Candidatus Hermodarchaeia archaeon]|jgi:xylulokinase